MTIRGIYTNYIAALNAHEYDALPHFVNDTVIHNTSAPLTPAAYGQLIIDSIRDFPGFLFEVDKLVVESVEDDEHKGDDDGVIGGGDNGTVAARLRLSYESTSASTSTSPSTSASALHAAGKEGEDGEEPGSAGVQARNHGGGSRIVFYEHVFYEFRGGKISRVWSLVDLPRS